MNLLTYVYTFTSFAFVESAFVIYRLQRKSPLNRITALLILWNALITLLRGLVPSAQTMGEARILASMTIALTCFNGPIVFHYCAILAKVDRFPAKQVLLVLFYAISFFLAIHSTVETFAIGAITPTRWGWDALPPDRRAYWGDTFYAFTLIFWIIGGGLIIKRLRISLDRAESKQLRTLGAFSLAGFISAVFMTIRSIANPVKLHPSTEILLTYLILLGLSAIWLLGLRAAMLKYNLLALHPTTPSGRIFSAMNCPLLMVDPEGHIRYANCEASGILSAAGLRDRTLLGAVMTDFFENGDSLKARMDDLRRGKKASQSCMLMLRQVCGKSGRSDKTHAACPILLNISIFPLLNERKELDGYLVLVSRPESLVRLRQSQNLTPRETEILLLLNEGFSTKEISVALFISELTAKTHIHRIYQKLEARNRVELTRIVKA